MDRERAISSFAESVVERHFTEFGINLVIEPTFGQKNPDFGVFDDSGNITAVIEVKSLTKAEFSQEVMEAVSVTTGVRRQMRDADKQFKGASHLPCLIVMDTSSTWIPGDASELAEAMLGSDVFRVVIYSDGSIGQGFAVDDRGYVEGKNTSSPNSRISAAAIRAHRTIACFEPDVEAGELLPNWMVAASNLSYSKFERDQRIGSLERPICVCSFDFLRIVRNPHAEIAWPSCLVGPWDEVYVPQTRPGDRVVLEHCGNILRDVPQDSIMF